VLSPDGYRRPSVLVTLLGGFGLMVGEAPATLAAGSERLVAFAALHCRAALPRSVIAGTFWPDLPERSGHANLRSALSRLRGPARQALEITANGLGLASDADVDLYRARATAHHILDPNSDSLTLNSSAVEQLASDLLPGWYDDWALLAAEEWRQFRLHALDALADDFIVAGRLAEAVAAAAVAAHADPLRESTQVLMVRAHLAQGNPSEALRAFQRYERRLGRDVGLGPTSRLLELVAELQDHRVRDDRHRSSGA
jgi:DNA-binding SARP family transcriptional activator